jgi:hypothetical protein
MPKLTRVRLPAGSTGDALSFVLGILAVDFVRVFKGERVRGGGGSYRREEVDEFGRNQPN